MCTINIYRNWLLLNVTRRFSEAWQIHRETGENTPIHSGNKQRQGPSWKNKPSLSGGLEDGDCLCADGRERAGWPGYAGCLNTLTHTQTQTCFWMMSLWLAVLRACSLLASAACLFFCCCCSLSCWILCSCSWTEAAWIVTTFPICADDKVWWGVRFWILEDFESRSVKQWWSVNCAEWWGCIKTLSKVQWRWQRLHLA